MAFQGLSGLAGGVGLVGDPSGAAVGIPVAWLEGSPFTDFLLPGLVLFTVLGVAPLLTVYGLWRGQAWSWTASMLVGGALLGWLGVQVAVIGYVEEPPLQLIYGGLGGLILLFTALPTVRKDLTGRR